MNKNKNRSSSRASLARTAQPTLPVARDAKEKRQVFYLGSPQEKQEFVNDAKEWDTPSAFVRFLYRRWKRERKAAAQQPQPEAPGR